MAKNRKTDEAMENAASAETGVMDGDTGALAATDGALETTDISEADNAGVTASGNDASHAVDAGGDLQAATAHDEDIPGGKEQAPAAGEVREVTGAYSSGLESVNTLADRHRVPSWQLAALLRLMDWEDDIMVSDGDFQAAIGKLNQRRIGGGRGV